MQKTFLLDTNVLMKYPNAIYGFDDNEVVITATTIEELDNLKNLPGERGYSARNALRHIDELRMESKTQKTSLSKGVTINENGKLRLENNHIDTDALPQGWDIHKADNRIIACAKNIGAILVTEDRGMAIKADELGILVQSYKNAEVSDENEYKGYAYAWIPEGDLITFFTDKKLKAKKKYFTGASAPEENEYFILQNSSDPQRTALARYAEGYFVPLVELPGDCKVKPRNVQQRFMIDALMNDVPLVIIDGPAGASKTFLTVVAAMQGYMHDKWSQIICTRNNVEMDSHGIGALPGDEVEKIGPLMRGVCDNLRNYLLIQETDEKDIRDTINDYLDAEIIKFEAMSFMRGRSIMDSLIFLDECQNATPHQIHSIITRAGERTKVVCCGDPSQIDDIKLDKKNNGLIFAKNSMRNCKYSGQLTIGNDMEVLQRSPLSAAATERMNRAFA